MPKLRTSECLTVAWLVSLIAAIPAAAGWAWLGPKLDKLTASDWAGWVQAIGSIGAIGAATWIASRQSREAQQERRNEAAEPLEALAALIQQLRRSVATFGTTKKAASKTSGSFLPTVRSTPRGRQFVFLRDALMRVEPEKQQSEVAVLVVSNLQPLLADLTLGAGAQEYFHQSPAGQLQEAMFLQLADNYVVLLRAAASQVRSGVMPFFPEPRPDAAAD